MTDPQGGVERIVRIVRDAVPQTFLEELTITAARVEEVWLISPWIGLFEDQEFTLQKACARFRRDQAYVHVVTRPPTEPVHLKALEMIGEVPTADIRLLDVLHAKLYVLMQRGESVALVGSANLTEMGHRWIEIGLLIRGRSWGNDLVAGLRLSAGEIMRSKGNVRVKLPMRPMDLKLLTASMAALGGRANRPERDYPA